MDMNQGGHNCFKLFQVKDQNSVLLTPDKENTPTVRMLLQSHLEWVILVSVKGRVTWSCYH